MTRWTKGKPADQAPLDTPVLARYDAAGRMARYAVVIRSAGPWSSYGGEPAKPTYAWRYVPTGAHADKPDRFWSLPEN